jgi:hypothetical protein
VARVSCTEEAVAQCWRDLAFAIIYQALRDWAGRGCPVRGGKKTDIRRLRAYYRGSASRFLQSDWCRSLCAWLGIDYGEMMRQLQALGPDGLARRLQDRGLKRLVACD